MAGNCLPYHQPCPITLQPTQVLLPTRAYANGTREEFLLARSPGGPVTDHPCSLPASPEASGEADVC